MKDTREDILTQSFELFYTQGYHGTGISDILKACKLHKGSLYHIFKSKKELALAVIDERIKKRFDLKFGPILNSDKAIDELFAILRDRIDFDFKRGCALNNFIQEMSNIDEDFKKALENVYLHLQSFYEKALDALFPQENNQALAQFLLSSVEGALVASKVSQDSKPYFEIIDQLQTCILTKAKQ